ncbi:MAG: hypothetical protein M5R40_28635 [Anaerolineae bacterium]|nr:hypothetical protein [Anaerolineae bacterium]
MVCTIVDEPERGLEMGAAEYLVKPFVEEDLVDAVRRIEAKLSDQEKTVTETPE